jgi:hypothetical protein
MNSLRPCVIFGCCTLTEGTPNTYAASVHERSTQGWMLEFEVSIERQKLSFAPLIAVIPLRMQAFPYIVLNSLWHV